jgi:hypothetical protein
MRKAVAGGQRIDVNRSGKLNSERCSCCEDTRSVKNLFVVKKGFGCGRMQTLHLDAQPTNQKQILYLFYNQIKSYGLKFLRPTSSGAVTKIAHTMANLVWCVSIALAVLPADFAFGLP